MKKRIMKQFSRKQFQPPEMKCVPIWGAICGTSQAYNVKWKPLRKEPFFRDNSYRSWSSFHYNKKRQKLTTKAKTLARSVFLKAIKLRI